MRVSTSVTAITLAAGVALGLVCVAAQGPLPGDVALTRALQELLGAKPAWAGVLTDTAKPPLVWATAAVAAALAWLRGGAWGAAAPPAAFAVSSVADLALRALIFAPRPTAELVAVAGTPAGSGLPSTFVLVYGTLFGAVLLVRGAGRAGAAHAAGSAAAVASVLLIAAGSCARIVLAGHWPSQVAASLLLALAIASALCAALARVARRT